MLECEVAAAGGAPVPLLLKHICHVVAVIYPPIEAGYFNWADVIGYLEAALTYAFVCVEGSIGAIRESIEHQLQAAACVAHVNSKLSAIQNSLALVAVQPEVVVSRGFRALNDDFPDRTAFVFSKEIGNGPFGSWLHSRNHFVLVHV